MIPRSWFFLSAARVGAACVACVVGLLLPAAVQAAASSAAPAKAPTSAEEAFAAFGTVETPPATSASAARGAAPGGASGAKGEKAGAGGASTAKASAAKKTPTPAPALLPDPVAQLLETLAAPAAKDWQSKDFAGVRAAYGRVLERADAKPHQRSYARLRIAQSFVAEKKTAEARAAYAALSADADAPDVHRAEAAECVREIDREATGQPKRDVLATRTPIPEIETWAAAFFVSPRGDDAHPGTAEKPFATPERARDAVRALRAKHAGKLPGAVAVNFLPGDYVRSTTFALDASDSGTAEAPVVYRSTESGAAVFYGGQRLRGARPVDDPAILARLPAEARGRVWVCDLSGQGVKDIPPLSERGYGVQPPAQTLEFFCDGQPLRAARWPDTGFVNGGAILEPGSKPAGNPAVFTYLDDRHARWTQAPDAWLYGYFAHGWADRTIPVVKIDPTTRRVEAGPYWYGNSGMTPVKWFNQGRIKYHVFNLLEELDQPGESYVDRAAGRLYFYPTSDPRRAVFEAGRLTVPMLVAKGLAHVRFEGIVFDLSRVQAIDLRDCESVLVAGCTVRRFAGEGIGIRGGRACGIFGCDLHSLGRNATTVIGGDRATLTPARHFVENCHMYDFGRLDHTYVPAVQLEGVGNRVAHNFFHDCPSSVVRVEGNDHVLEYNDVVRVVLESEDQGAMELFGNPTYRGVVFRHNRFADIGGPYEGGSAGRAGIRLDDAISGIAIYGNLFVRAAQSFGGINMNGGRDNIIDNNLFVECEKGITGGYNAKNKHWQNYAEAVNSPRLIKSPLYDERYPALRRALEQPGWNNAWRAVFWKCGPAFSKYGKPSIGEFDTLGILEYPKGEYVGFVDAEAGDFRLRPDSELVARIGFRPLPLREIGAYAHRLRASWPLQPGR